MHLISLDYKTNILNNLQPWGAVSNHRRMVAENEAKRQEHIRVVYAKIETTDSSVMQQREHILSLNFFELRGKFSFKEIAYTEHSGRI